jgi:DNA-3-methyladenine glycosylase II
MDKRIQQHFQKNDPVLHKALRRLAGKTDHLTPTKTTDYFAHLCEGIVSQQLSEKAGSTIWNRLLDLFPGKKITPEKLLGLSDDKIRVVGTSNSKVLYLKNLARDVVDNKLHLETLPEMKDTDVIIELTKVKGIGPWTAEMFLMFALGREDVFSYGDLGLHNAMKRLYRWKKEPTKKQIDKIVVKWSPYKTYACRLLWKSLELS